jgi:hypothetical protein
VNDSHTRVKGTMKRRLPWEPLSKIDRSYPKMGWFGHILSFLKRLRMLNNENINSFSS